MIFAACAPADRSGCPAAFSDAIGTTAAITCTLLNEGRLASARDNPDVLYRVYRWAEAGGDAGNIYDVPPYNQVAVSLYSADAPDDVLWLGRHWLGVGWFETPVLAENADHGEFLIVPGRYAGTGAFVEDRVFVGRGPEGWQPVAGTQLDPESTAGWLAGLGDHLPDGHYLAKGIHVDYATLSGRSDVWRRDDANCCPTGGWVSFRLTLDDPADGFTLADAEFSP